MAPPGSLEARYERLAGPEDRRLELYLARRRLGYTIEEWRALPWWQRRVYLEGIEAEFAPQDGGSGGGSGLDPYDALMNGPIEDVRAAGYGKG